MPAQLPNSIRHHEIISIGKATALVKGRYAYVDMLQVWLARPLTPAEQSGLRRQCGSLHVSDEAMSYQPKWQQRLQIRQPTAKAFRQLQRFTSGEYLINKVELALDLTTTTALDSRRLQEFFETHWVQPWRRGQKLGKVGSTAYSGRHRWKRNAHVIYSDRVSKITGEANTCHLEWRISTKSAVSSAGINNFYDVLTFDHRQFWTKQLRLRAIDASKLGRTRLRTRRRKAWLKAGVNGREFDFDAKVGNIVARAAQREGPDGQPDRPLWCVQAIKDRSNFDISRAVAKLSNEWFLPKP